MPSITRWLAAVTTLTYCVLAQSWGNLPVCGVSRYLGPREQLDVVIVSLAELLDHCNGVHRMSHEELVL